MPPLTTRTTRPCSSSVAPSGSLGAEEDEVAVPLGAVVAGRDESGSHPFPLGDRLRDVDARVAQGRSADPGGRTADARRGPAQLELCRHLRRRHRPANAKGCEAESLRERPQDDHVRLLGDQGHTGRAGVLVVGLVDDDDG